MTSQRLLGHLVRRCVTRSVCTEGMTARVWSPAWRPGTPYTCICSPLTARKYSHQADKQPQLTAKVVEIPNPLNLLWNMWYLSKIHRNVDPDFDLDEFSAGAKYAVCTLCDLLANRQYTQLKDIFYQGTDQSISFLQNYMDSLPNNEIVKQVNFGPDQLSILRPHITNVTNHSGEDVVRVSVHAIGTKPVTDNLALMMQLQLGLIQLYRGGIGSGWYLLDVGMINIREVTFQNSEDK